MLGGITMGHKEAFDLTSVLREALRLKTFEDFEPYLLTKHAITLSELVLLFSRGIPSRELEKDIPDMEYLIRVETLCATD